MAATDVEFSVEFAIVSFHVSFVLENKQIVTRFHTSPYGGTDDKQYIH